MLCIDQDLKYYFNTMLLEFNIIEINTYRLMVKKCNAHWHSSDAYWHNRYVLFPWSYQHDQTYAA